jgi:ribosomal protein L29
MKKVQALKKMTDGDLEKKLVSLRENLRALRFRLEGSKSKNVKEEKGLKKDIARALTFLRERKYGK